MSVDSLALRGESRAPGRTLLGLAALICIGVQVPGSLLLSGLALALWLGLLAAFDRPSLKRLWMPRFWLVTLVFAVASGLLLGPKATRGTGAVLSPEGLKAGLLMVFRGAFIFGLAAWASRALGGESLQRLTARIGLARLGTSLVTALKLLPELKDRLHAHTKRRPARSRWHRFRRFPELAAEVICETAGLAAEMASRSAPSRRPLVVAVIGAPGSGKTTLVSEFVRRLRERGLSVGGATQPAVVEDGHRVGYLLRDESTGELRPFAHRKEKATEGELGFSFDAQAWSWAAERIRDAGQVDVLAFDELGRLEAGGEGHMATILHAVSNAPPRALVLGVRADCVAAIREQLGPFDLELSTGADSSSVEELTEGVARACLSSRVSEPTYGGGMSGASEPDASPAP